MKRSSRFADQGQDRPYCVISDNNGRISPIPAIEAAGMKAGSFFRLSARELVPLPAGSELFRLPERIPVGYDPNSRTFIRVGAHQISKKTGACSAVAAFVPPGYTVTYCSAYEETARSRTLPLFSYAAVCLYKGGLHAACVRIDRDPRHDLEAITIGLVRKNIRRYKKLFERNRLIGHLATCALTYGCPNAMNFFLGRYEAPLPTSRSCNARCAGCISSQAEPGCSPAQPRIAFTPSPAEIAQIALFHIENVPDPIVSFGQGCEGEPLMRSALIEAAIRLIRRSTSRGVIHLNTNGSMPESIGRLFRAGLDSIRVSMNSVIPDRYDRYARPRGYTFRDVVRSIRIATRLGGFVSVNYLTMPGFTDSTEEFEAFRRFVRRYRINMVQWRNLNYDPMAYTRIAGGTPDPGRMLGIRRIIGALKKEFPGMMQGYFNPAKGRMRKYPRM